MHIDGVTQTRHMKMLATSPAPSHLLTFSHVLPAEAMDTDLCCIGCGHLGKPGPGTGTGIRTNDQSLMISWLFEAAV